MSFDFLCMYCVFTAFGRVTRLSSSVFKIWIANNCFIRIICPREKQFTIVYNLQLQLKAHNNLQFTIKGSLDAHVFSLRICVYHWKWEV